MAGEEPAGAIGIIDAHIVIACRTQLLGAHLRAPRPQPRRGPPQHALSSRRVHEQVGLKAQRTAAAISVPIDLDGPHPPVAINVNGGDLRLVEQFDAGVAGPLTQPASQRHHVRSHHGGVVDRKRVTMVGPEKVSR